MPPNNSAPNTNQSTGTQFASASMPELRPPSPKNRPYLKWIVVGLVLLFLVSGAAWAAIKFTSNDTGSALPTPKPNVQKGLSNSESSNIKSSSLTGTSQLDVTALTAQTGDITKLVTKALQVTEGVDIQGALNVGGSGTFGGNLTAANFTGNGAGVTGVNAALLGGQARPYYEGLAAAATQAATTARATAGAATATANGAAGSVSGLAANAALKNGTNTFTGSNVFNAGLTTSSLNVTGTATFGNLVLTSPLDISNGGTGITSAPAASVLYGTGGSSLGVATPVAAGLCLVSGTTDVQWSSCSGAGGVAAINGLTGAVTVSGASVAGSTITINDATTTTKGLASFNTSNFTVTAGAVNTAQNIGVGASPTFAGLSLSSALGVAAGGTGAATLPANGVVVGNGTSALSAVTAGSTGQCLISTAGAPSFQACPGGGAVTSVNSQTGAVSVANATGSGGVITVQDASTAQKGLAQFNATNFTVTGGTANTIQNIATTSSPTFAAVNTNALNPSAALTVGSTTQSLTLQGSNTTITATNGASLAQLTFVAPTANVTYRLQTAAAGTYDVCTTAGNCVGSGGAVSTSGGSAGVIPKYTSASALGASLLTDNGTLVTVGGNLSVTGTVSLTSALTLANGGTAATSASGARTNLGAAGSGSNSDITSLSGLTTAVSIVQGGTGATTLATNGILLGNGTSPISSLVAGAAGQCLISNAGAPSWQACPGAAGSGVSSLNSLTGVLTLANSSGIGTTITIDDATTVAKGIASFNSTNFTASSGAVNTVQNINSSASPTFAGVNTNTITPSAALTVGATAQAFTIQGNASSVFRATSGANSTTVGFATPTATTTLNFPASAAGTYTVCTTVGNCVGSGGGVTTAGGTTGQLAKFSGAQTLADSIISDNGTTVTIAGGTAVQGTGGLSLGVGSTTTGKIAFNNSTNANTTTLQSGAAGSNLTFTLPVADGAAGSCLTTNASGVLSFASCLTGSGGGSGGVASLNGLSGALSVANASGSGATITINDASTSAKGIAQFNATNFQAASGTINTIQDIATSASPSFAALSLTSATGLAIGSGTALGQLALRDGSSAFNVKFQPANLSANRTITIPNAGGTLAVSASGNIALDVAGNLTLTGQVPVTNGGTGSSTASGARSNLGAAASGANADISSTTALNTITPSSALTIGATSQAFTVQGNGTSVFTATTTGNTTTVGFTAPTANTTLNFPASAAGTYTVCTTVGNCVGSGGGVSTAGGSTNRIPKFSGAQTLTDSIISESGSAITIAGSALVQGSAGLTLGVSSTANGKIVFNNSTNANTTTLQSGAAGSNLTFTLPVADGSAGNCLTTNASGVLSFAACLTGAAGGSGGVASLNGLSGALSVANASGSGATITINDASTAAKGIAQFNATNFQAASGTINTIQDIATSSSPSFAALAVTSATGLTIGTGSNLGQLALRDGSSAFNVKFQPSSLSANRTITVPDAGGTLAVSASGNIALDAVGNLTLTGQVGVANGGTGVATLTANGLVLGNGTSAVTTVTPGTTGQCLLGNTGSAPTFGTCGGGGGVSSLNSQTGAVTLANATASAGTVTIDNATTAAKGIASFNSANFSVTSGAVNTVQGISTTATPTFTSLTLTGTTALSLGTASANAGATRFYNASNANTTTLQSGVATSSYTITLPAAAPGTSQCLGTDSVTASQLVFSTCGSGITTVGTFSASSQTNGATISGSTITFGPADATNPGMVTTGAQTLAGAKTFTGNTIYTGTILQKSDSASAFILQDSTGTYSNLAFDSSTGHLKVYDHSNPRTAYADIYYASGTAVFAASTGTTQIGAGTGDVTVALTNNAEKFNFTHTGTTAAGTDDFIVQRNITGGAANLSGNVLRVEDLSTTSGTKTANLLYINQSVVGTGNLILAQTGGSTTKFAVSPAGAVSIASGQSITGLGALTVDSAAATALNLGSTNATTLTLGGTTATSTLTLNAAAAGIINIGAGAQAHTVNVGTGAATQGVTLGSTSGASALVLNSGTGSISLGTSASARTISLGTAAAVQAVTVGSTNTTSSLTLQSGTGALALQSQGTITIGTNAVAQTITIGSTTAGTLRIGQNAGSLQIDGPNFDVATTGLVTLLGGLSPDLTTGVVSGAGQNLTLQPGTSTGASINGGVTTLKGGDSSGTTSVTGGALALQGGNATGASGTRTGGSVTLDAGTGASGNGAISIGGTNATGVAIGNANIPLNLNGQVTSKVATDSTTAFVMQDASSNAIFTADTVNGRLYVGPTGGNSSGISLVLGNKTAYTGGAQAGDPTGVAGAMYYNATIGTFRCYEGSYWTNCIQSARTSYHATDEMFGASTSTDDFLAYTANGGTISTDTVGGVTGHAGINTADSGTATNGSAGILQPGTGVSTLLGNGDYWRYEADLRLPTLSGTTDRYVLRVGWNNATGSDGTNGCMFKYSDNINSGAFQGQCSNNSTVSTCNAGITPSAATWYRLTVAVNSAGNSADFRINGTSACTISTNIPTVSGRQVSAQTVLTKTAGTSSRTMDLDYVDLEGQYGTSR